MRKFIRLIALCSSCLCLLCLLAMLWGRLYSDQPAEVAVFDPAQCDGVPCVFGLQPGVSSWRDAESVFEQLEDYQRFSGYVVIPLAQRSEIAIFRSVDKLSVGRINVSLPSHTKLSAGWLVRHHGEPCGVTLYNGARMITLRYPYLLANIYMDGDPMFNARLTPTAPVLNFMITDPKFTGLPNLCQDRVTSRDAVNRAWYGFASLRHYLSRIFF
jgi:hypothetical protein